MIGLLNCCEFNAALAVCRGDSVGDGVDGDWLFECGVVVRVVASPPPPPPPAADDISSMSTISSTLIEERIKKMEGKKKEGENHEFHSRLSFHHIIHQSSFNDQ